MSLLSYCYSSKKKKEFGKFDYLSCEVYIYIVLGDRGRGGQGGTIALPQLFWFLLIHGSSKFFIAM